MAKNRRSELLGELHHAKQALQASEKRSRRAVKRLRELEKAMEPIMKRIEMWASMPLSDEQNAFKVMTVGDCRKLLPLLREEEKPQQGEASEDGEAEEDAVAA